MTGAYCSWTTKVKVMSTDDRCACCWTTTTPKWRCSVRWFPGERLCNACGVKERRWTAPERRCTACGQSKPYPSAFGTRRMRVRGMEREVPQSQCRECRRLAASRSRAQRRAFARQFHEEVRP